MQHKRLVLDIPWPTEPLAWFAKLIRGWFPSRGNVLFTLLMISGLLWVQTAGAIPARQPASSISTIPYQGRLADAGGLPLTGTYTMVFRLYSAATGGTPLWEESWTGPNGVQAADGLFNVMLGSLTPIPQSVITGNSNLWLGVTVGTDSEMVPRVQIGTLPFAVQALSVPDGSISSDKLALQNGSVCLTAATTSVPVPGNYSSVVISGTSLPLTLAVSSKVLLWTSGNYNFNVPNHYVGTAVYLDGSELINTDELAPNTAWNDFTLIRQIIIAPGAHTLDLRTFAQISGTMTYAGEGKNTCLEYVVLN